jgi:hypothetical protein
VSKLVNLDEGHDEHDVHDGGAKLHASVDWAEVEDATANSLQNQANTKYVENTVLLVRSKYLTVFLLLHTKNHCFFLTRKMNTMP